MVQNVKNKFLCLFKTIEFRASAIKKIKQEIIANIIYKKQKQLDKKAVN